MDEKQCKKLIAAVYKIDEKYWKNPAGTESSMAIAEAVRIAKGIEEGKGAD